MQYLMFFTALLGLTFTTIAQEKTPEDAEVKKEVILTLKQARVIKNVGGNPDFCAGILEIENKMELPITEFSIHLVYNNSRIPFYFDKIPVNQTVNQRFGLAGNACEAFFQPPKIQVQKCKLAKNLGSCRDSIRYQIKMEN